MSHEAPRGDEAASRSSSVESGAAHDVAPVTRSDEPSSGSSAERGAAHDAAPVSRGDEPTPDNSPKSESFLTVLIALVVNALIALAKSVAGALSGSASMVAEAAHSWADTGNEIFLLIAERRALKPADRAHPLGFGRDAYVWSMIAAFGLFVAGSILSIWHGITALSEGDREAFDPTLNYVILAIAFVLEGISFLRARKQANATAEERGMSRGRFIAHTSDPTLRAVYFEDATALVGLVIAAIGIFLHQITGDPVWDAVGSIVVGVLLGVVAVFLIDRNRDFLIGQAVSTADRTRALAMLMEYPAIARVTFLHMEFVGPAKILLVAAVDLIGDDRESEVAVRLRDLEHEIETDSPMVYLAVLTLSAPDEASINS